MEDTSFVEKALTNLREIREALVTEMHGGEARATSNEALCALIQAARGTLQLSGVVPGERVALLANNSARWIAADLAILAEGAVVVPLYARQAPAELAEIVKDAQVSLIVCEEQALADGLVAHYPDAEITTFDELFAGLPVDTPPHEIELQDAVTIIYTSGTSGRAKGVVLSRQNIEFMLPVTAGALNKLFGAQAESEPKQKVERVFHYLPFCFAGSRIVLWTSLVRAAPLFLSTNLDNLKQEFLAAKPSYFLNVPILLERIKNGVEASIAAKPKPIQTLYRAAKAAHLRKAAAEGRPGDGLLSALARKVIFKKIREGIGKDLQFLICGSAPLGEETQRWFEMIDLPVYQVYGLTETTAIVSMDEPRAVKPGRVGHALEGVELRIGDEGELQTRGPNVFVGYYRREQATREAFTEDGWFRTGDAAEIDDSGNLRIIGRTKNILVAESGHNIAPEPLEQHLLERITGAEHVVVFGHGRPYLTAVVTGNVEATEVAAAIDALNESLPHYRRIRRHHISGDSLTPENGLLTANQKLKRSALETHFEPTLQALYERQATDSASAAS